MITKYPVLAVDLDHLRELLGSVEVAATLTDAQLTGALQGSVMPTIVTDPLTGNVTVLYPSDVDYTPTYDYHFAAYNLIDLMASQPVVTNASSEGSSITTSAPNWDALRSYYRAGSFILGYNASAFDVIDIPTQRRVTRNNMNDMDTYYGNIDPDLN